MQLLFTNTLKKKVFQIQLICNTKIEIKEGKVMWITQEKYLEAANRNYKEWFVDNSYDVVFVPLVARDYLTAYLMKFQKLGRVAPDIDWVLEQLKKHDKACVDKFNPLDIRFKEGVKDIDYYIPLLKELANYVLTSLDPTQQSSITQGEIEDE